MFGYEIIIKIIYKELSFNNNTGLRQYFLNK